MPRKRDPHHARGNSGEGSRKHRETGLPFVTVKLATSLDGRIATRSGDSRWISGDAALRFAHRLRRENDAVVVGVGTVVADDPQLTVRLVPGRNPLRVVVDGRLRIPLAARVLSDGDIRSTLIATTRSADPDRMRELRELGAEVVVLPAARHARSKARVDESRKPASGQVQIAGLLAALGGRGIASVLVEGGGRVVTSFLAAGAVDRLVMIIAPKIIGSGIEGIGDLGIRRLQDAITFSRVKTRRLGPDIIFDGIVKKTTEY